MNGRSAKNIPRVYQKLPRHEVILLTGLALTVCFDSQSQGGGWETSQLHLAQIDRDTSDQNCS